MTTEERAMKRAKVTIDLEAMPFISMWNHHSRITWRPYIVGQSLVHPLPSYPVWKEQVYSTSTLSASPSFSRQRLFLSHPPTALWHRHYPLPEPICQRVFVLLIAANANAATTCAAALTIPDPAACIASKKRRGEKERRLESSPCSSNWQGSEVLPEPLRSA